MTHRKGVIYFETLFWLVLSISIIFLTHVELAGRWRRELIELQKKRMAYDGLNPWKLGMHMTPVGFVRRNPFRDEQIFVPNESLPTLQDQGTGSFSKALHAFARKRL